MNADNVIPEIWFLSVNFEKFPWINQESDQSQPSKRPTVIGRALLVYEVKFCKVNGQEQKF